MHYRTAHTHDGLISASVMALRSYNLLALGPTAGPVFYSLWRVEVSANIRSDFHDCMLTGCACVCLFALPFHVHSADADSHRVFVSGIHARASFEISA